MKDYYDKAISYGNMRRALKRCCRDVRWKDSVVGYELHAPQHTHELIDALKSNRYKISPYQRFTIYEPKKRDIVATRIQDRQVQMALCNGGLYRDITEHFIHDNCACQKGRGTDYAIKRIKTHIRRSYVENGTNSWVLQCDVRKFFPSTPHSVAKDAVRKRVHDERVRKLVFDIIDSFGGEKGIGLGSQVSQLIELAVLDNLDHFIKERLRIKHYVRYMDDFILIHPDREYLKQCREEIAKKLADIGLELNEKTKLFPIRQGIRFLQWRFCLTDTGKIIMKMSNKKVNREKRRLKKLIRKERAGELSSGTAGKSFESWRANAQRGQTYYQVKSVEQYFRKEVDKYDSATGNAKDGTRCVACQVSEQREFCQYRLSGDDDRCRNSY